MLVSVTSWLWDSGWIDPVFFPRDTEFVVSEATGLAQHLFIPAIPAWEGRGPFGSWNF